MQEGEKSYLGEDVFVVEEIRGKRRRDGEVEYLIKWEGWARSLHLSPRPDLYLPHAPHCYAAPSGGNPTQRIYDLA